MARAFNNVEPNYIGTSPPTLTPGLEMLYGPSPQINKLQLERRLAALGPEFGSLYLLQTALNHWSVTRLQGIWPPPPFLVSRHPNTCGLHTHTVIYIEIK